MHKILFILSILFFASTANAETGVIDNSALNQAKVCYDTTCTSPTPSIINFELSQQPSIVVDSVTGITGSVWGSSLGWIKFNPAGAGVSFADNKTGLLTGRAWSQVSGWINFGVTGQSVSVSPETGEINGWAWTGGPFGGWIKFDCGDPSTCVKTTWRVNKSVVLPILDVCPNIGENQLVIPPGYTINAQGQCIKIIDVCPNLPGEQSVVPVGYTTNSIGACIKQEFDYCPNIKGIQNNIPSNYMVNDQGLCVILPKDYCPDDLGVQNSYSDCTQVPVDFCINLPGVQNIVPNGNISIDNNCFPEFFDFCPNIDGSQVEIPNGFIVSDIGECIDAPEDLCDNLGGIQEKVPMGFKKKDAACFFANTIEEDFSSKNADGIRIIAFSFIPSALWIPSNNILLKEGVKLIDVVFNTTLTSVPYMVDIVSAVITISLLIILIIIIIFIIKKLKRNQKSSL